MAGIFGRSVFPSGGVTLSKAVEYLLKHAPRGLALQIYSHPFSLTDNAWDERFGTRYDNFLYPDLTLKNLLYTQGLHTGPDWPAKD